MIGVASAGTNEDAQKDPQDVKDEAAYSIMVMGDSLAGGLYRGLQQNFRDADGALFQVESQTKVNTGLVRSDRFDWPAEVETLTQSGTFDIAIIMLGGNDAQSFRMKGRRHHFQTEGWEEEYRRRIDHIVTTLKDKDIAVYWVGLPNIKNSKRREQFRHVNAIFKERAEAQGARYIDSWDITNDENGNFRPSGKALNGKKVLLRARDGTHFTFAGNRVLARHIEKAVRVDFIDKDKSITAGVYKKDIPEQPVTSDYRQKN